MLSLSLALTPLTIWALTPHASSTSIAILYRIFCTQTPCLSTLHLKQTL